MAQCDQTLEWRLIKPQEKIIGKRLNRISVVPLYRSFQFARISLLPVAGCQDIIVKIIDDPGPIVLRPSLSKGLLLTLKTVHRLLIKLYNIPRHLSTIRSNFYHSLHVLQIFSMIAFFTKYRYNKTEQQRGNGG